MSTHGNIWRKIHGAVTKRPTNFSWVIEEALAGSGMPTSQEEMIWLKNMGIRAILTLTEDPLPREWIDNSISMDYMHLPVMDHGAPTLEDLDKAVDFIDERIKVKKPVLVHCAAGKGRTGTILAAYLMKFEKLDVTSAIEKIRNLRPGSIQSYSQEMALDLYQKYLDGL